MGARQTGKTTLLKEIIKDTSDVLWLNADEPDVSVLLEHATSSRLRQLIGSKRIVIIDEAQRIRDIGLKLKLITDELPEVQLIATGSSSFELANQVNEPLTGRKWQYNLYALSYGEMVAHHGFMEEDRLLPTRLVYGYYPDVVNSPGQEKEVLRQLSDSYLYKDLLTWDKIKKPDRLIKLLQALAHQVGSEISYNNLGNLLGMDNQTVEKYIDLLEKTYVIFRLSAFSRNLRKELKKSRKVYFYDNGIRNALIANFTIPELRSDIGALWENFVISERLKYIQYQQIWSNTYFWRTHDQQEIDYIEERDGQLHAYEIKWNPVRKVVPSKSFTNRYPSHTFDVIRPGNIAGFLTKGE
jgi:predicted AAA+ superfamily ATPase